MWVRVIIITNLGGLIVPRTLRSALLVAPMVATWIACGSAHAASVSYSDFVDFTKTNWTDSVDLTLFNPLLGTLTGVEFKLTGKIQSSVGVENVDDAPSSVDVTVTANISLSRPDTSDIVTADPSVHVLANLGQFDGNVNFDGPSGDTYDLSGQKMVTHNSPPPASDLTLFVGVGTITLPVKAIAATVATGPGNFDLRIRTSARADVEITYFFTPVPEPAPMAGLAIGIAGALSLRSRRRR